MTEKDVQTQNQDERVLAAVSHVTALLPFIGVIAPIIIWVTQKDKSRYVAFQALQALVYQLTMVLGYFLGMACYIGSYVVAFIPLPFLASSDSPDAAGWIIAITVIFPFLLLGLVFLLGYAFIVYGIVAAVMSLQGKPFRYLVIGRRIEQFMEKDSPAENAGS